jgi:hypothetical protein
MPTLVRLQESRDFRAGLNLVADAFQLQPGETPDCLNVTLQMNGGFRSRDVVAPLNSTALTNTPQSIWSYTNDSGTNQVLVAQGTKVSFSTGGNFTDITVTLGGTTPKVRACTFNNANYWVSTDGSTFDAPRRWTGSGTPTSLTQTFVDSYTGSPLTGNMPKARLITAHMGYVWVANTSESGTAYPNRIRWSHPNKPEAWRTNDYIDLDVGFDGDEITAIVPWSDRLLIFKRNSVHALVGYSPDTFQVFPISQTAGAVSQEAVAKSEFGVFFFNWPDGAFLYDGRSVRWLFARLKPLVTGDNNVTPIPAAYQGKVTVGWLKRRAWFAVPLGAATSNTAVFVYDPALSQEGGWTKYDLALGPMLEWRQSGASTLHLACQTGSNKRVLKVEQTTGNQDDFGAGVTNFTSYYTTHWETAGSAVQKKRWRRPEFVIDGDVDATLTVKVWKNFDPTLLARQFAISATAPPVGFIWGTSNWGQAVWSTSATGAQDIVRGTGLGVGRAVQLQISGPSTSRRWSVNNIGWKFVPRRIR